MIELHHVSDSDASSNEPSTPRHASFTTRNTSFGRSGPAESHLGGSSHFHPTATVTGSQEGVLPRQGLEAPPAADATTRTTLAPPSVPCYLRPFVQVLLYDCVLETDDLDTVLRKATITVGGALAILSSLWCLTIIMANGFTNGGIAVLCCGIAQQFGTGLYAHLRCTHKVSLPLLCVHFAVLTGNLAVVAVANPCAGAAAFSQLLAIAIVLCKMPHRLLWLAALLLIAGVASYNEAVLLDHGFQIGGGGGDNSSLPMLLAIPGYLEAGTATVVGERIATFIAMLLLVTGIRSVLNDHVAQSRAARHSANLAGDVAVALAAYNTPAASTLLERATAQRSSGQSATSPPPLPTPEVAPIPFHGEKLSATTASMRVPTAGEATTIGNTTTTIGVGAKPSPDCPSDRYRHADGRLIDILRVIVSNFDAYRPHLPNWVLREASLGDGSTAAPQRGVSSPHKGPNAYQTPAAAAYHQRSTGGANTDAHHFESAGKRKVSSQRSFRIHATGGTPSAGGLPTAAGSGDHSTRAAASVIPRLPRTVMETRDYAEAALSFTIGVDRFSPRDLASLSHTIVDSIHDAARITFGAVMSISGDAASVTWNTAIPLDQPAMHATHFLAILREAVVSMWNTKAVLFARRGKTPPLIVAGVAVAGQCRVHLGGNASRHRAVVAVPCDELLPRLRERLLGCAYRCMASVFLADSGCAEAAGNAVQSRGVMALSLPVPQGNAGASTPHSMHHAVGGNEGPAGPVSVAIGHGVVATLPASAVFVTTVPTNIRVARIFEIVGTIQHADSPSALASPDDRDLSGGSGDAPSAPAPIDGFPQYHQRRHARRRSSDDDPLALLGTVDSAPPPPAVQNVAHATVTRALLLCLRGFYADAVSDLESVGPAYLAAAPLVRVLLRRARRFATESRADNDTTPDSFAMPLSCCSHAAE